MNSHRSFSLVCVEQRPKQLKAVCNKSWGVSAAEPPVFNLSVVFPCRAGAGAAQEAPEELRGEDDEHQEPVEEHRGAVRQLVSAAEAEPPLRLPPPPGPSLIPPTVCVSVQPDGLWDPPLLRPQHDGPGGPAHGPVPRRLLHHGWHRRGNLPGPLPRRGADGTPRGAAGLHDRDGPGVSAAAGAPEP